MTQLEYSSRQSSRQHSWWALSTMLFTALLLCPTLAGLEYASYKWILGGDLLILDTYDVTLALWSLTSITLLLLMPPIFASVAFACIQYRRSAFTCYSIGATFVFAFLFLDVRLQGVTGWHLVDYLIFADKPTTWEWGIQDPTIVYKCFRWLAMAGCSCFGTILVVYVFAQSLARRIAWLRGRRLSLLLAAVYCVVIVALIPARRYVNNSVVLDQLYRALPIELWLCSPNTLPRTNLTAFGIDVDARFEKALAPHYGALTHVSNVDNSIVVPSIPPVNVIVIVVESLRYDMVTADIMPRLFAFSQNGLRFNRHYSPSNMSVFGGFSIMYGRPPSTFFATMRAGVRPQLVETLKKSGYETWLITSCDFANDPWGISDFMNDSYFDHMTFNSAPDWPTRDRAGCAQMRRILDRSVDRPNLIVTWLLSTHFAYAYPPEYNRFKSSRTLPKEWDTGESLSFGDLCAHYKNAAAFTDDLLGDIFDTVDLSRNIVVVVGDHGESLGEDSCIGHGSRLSEYQTRTVAMMIGYGVPSRELNSISSHCDLIPTLLHALVGTTIKVAGVWGYDRLAAGQGVEQEVLLSQLRKNAWEFTLIRPDGRLMFSVAKTCPLIHVLGFSTDDGRVSAQLRKSVSDVPVWIDSLQRVLDPCGGDTHASTE